VTCLRFATRGPRFRGPDVACALCATASIELDYRDLDRPLRRRTRIRNAAQPANLDSSAVVPSLDADGDRGVLARERSLLKAARARCVCGTTRIGATDRTARGAAAFELVVLSVLEHSNRKLQARPRGL
jgi:hypothetical protein